ncbi:Peroxisomal membrane protein PEX31 [Nakaseomyces bracarensis]|uniref:Peroxisomal membrane protein PEX31 n=1 Tax=Nakaseomyces bracarensis TaxID=273131 RepID=A0ABR4NV68_9SACH
MSDKREVRAKFVENSQPRLGLDTTKVILKALHEGKVHEEVTDSVAVDDDEENEDSRDGMLVLPSPLLSSTPPSVVRSMVRLYPYLKLADKALGILTWSDFSIWNSVVLVPLYTLFILYYEVFVMYLGHMVVILSVLALMWVYNFVENTEDVPILEDIVVKMNRVQYKFDKFIEPLITLKDQDLTKLLYATILFSPVYVFLSCLFGIRFIKFNVVAMGILVLTYHSPWCKTLRRILWKFKIIRNLIYKVMGIETYELQEPKITLDKKYRFTYVLYENQRRWLGIGWNSSMLGYERTPWTDEFLNEASKPSEFQLPNKEWKWLDHDWKLDLSNDGAIEVEGEKFVTNPGVNDGYIYYDNTWKNPSVEDTFSKYTRRRRWIRTAELIEK